MMHALTILVRDFGWIHLSVGLVGNVLFFCGSILFFERFREYKHLAVWLFVVGSFLMLVGSLGRLLVSIRERH